MDGGLEKYMNRFVDSVLLYAVHVVLAALAYIVLFYAVKAGWYIFTETPVGQHHNQLFPERAAIIEGIFYGNILGTAVRIMAVCLASGFVLALAGRLLHVYRYLYESMDNLGRFFIWGMPVAAYSSWAVCNNEWIESYPIAAFFSFFPSMLFTRSTVRFCNAAVPEMGSLVSSVYSFIKRR
jgi:hypothetical protein